MTCRYGRVNEVLRFAMNDIHTVSLPFLHNVPSITTILSTMVPYIDVF